MQVIERPAHPHFHLAREVDERRGERDRLRNPDPLPVVTSPPLTDRGRHERDANQYCVIGRIFWSLLCSSRSRAKSRYGEFWLLIRTQNATIIGWCLEHVRQRGPEHARTGRCANGFPVTAFFRLLSRVK